MGITLFGSGVKKGMNEVPGSQCKTLWSLLYTISVVSTEKCKQLGRHSVQSSHSGQKEMVLILHPRVTLTP